jgi:hypothetical protein
MHHCVRPYSFLWISRLRCCAADRVKLAAQLKELQAELKKLNEEGSLPGANKLSLSEMCARPLSCSLARLSIFGN